MNRLLISVYLATRLAVAADRPTPPVAASPKPAASTTSGTAAARMQTTAMRNENVAVNQIDNNAIKEANVRVGTTTTLVSDATVENGYFATEFGRPLTAPPLLPNSAPLRDWHGELFGFHQNAVFNARSFFQVGGVKPSHRNFYGGRFSGGLGAHTWLTGSFSQRDVRGMVNGNVLVPLANERTPRTNDPSLRALIARFIQAYPNELPNRPDFDMRALNTNAPQRIDDLESILRLNHDLSHNRGRLSASHTLTRQRIDAFQLVAGQNPDNEIHTHRGQLTWRGSLHGFDSAIGATFQRTKTALLPEPNAIPMRVRIGYQIEELGPDSEFPVDRATNSYRYGAVFGRTLGSRHNLTFGADLTRFQLNGVETMSTRGYFSFTNAYGRSAIENFLTGTPAYYEVTLGPLSRGFRNWTANAFFADRFKVNSRLQIYWGLRYSAVTGPVEVNNFHPQLYPCDCNNFSPRLSLAIQLKPTWIVRTSYTTSFGDVPPVTYQQQRFNLPWVRYVQVQNPSLLHPLEGANLGRTSPTILTNLVSAYAHQYNFSLEHRLKSGAILRTSYIGSRSLKMVNPYIENRAAVVPGVPLTLETVDQRRPDPRFYEVRYIVNAGIGYFNAAQAAIDIPYWRGFRASLAYTFSKAIDEGVDFTSTAANRDSARGRSQSQYDSLIDRRGLSNFDSPHALLANYTYDLPRLTTTHGIAGALLNNWQLAGVVLAKSGTPLTLYIGSDAPGIGNVDGGPSDRPNILDPSILGRTIGNPDTAPIILSRDKFAYIPVGQLRGSLGKNTFRKSRIANWNAALTKQWTWNSHREYRLQFRVETYNFTNTPQFDEPQRNLTSPAFGKITNTLNDGRVFQLGLRFFL
ncbi:MAG: hypothetical protein IT168_15805 [Bryobacterales bacterium]|nr:hypothetical protein [Bryobacterales bacterium]